VPESISGILVISDGKYFSLCVLNPLELWMYAVSFVFKVLLLWQDWRTLWIIAHTKHLDLYSLQHYWLLWTVFLIWHIVGKTLACQCYLEYFVTIF